MVQLDWLVVAWTKPPFPTLMPLDVKLPQNFAITKVRNTLISHVQAFEADF